MNKGVPIVVRREQRAAKSELDGEETWKGKVGPRGPVLPGSLSELYRLLCSRRGAGRETLAQRTDSGRSLLGISSGSLSSRVVLPMSHDWPYS